MFPTIEATHLYDMVLAANGLTQFDFDLRVQELVQAHGFKHEHAVTALGNLLAEGTLTGSKPS